MECVYSYITFIYIHVHMYQCIYMYRDGTKCISFNVLEIDKVMITLNVWWFACVTRHIILLSLQRALNDIRRKWLWYIHMYVHNYIHLNVITIYSLADYNKLLNIHTYLMKIYNLFNKSIGDIKFEKNIYFYYLADLFIYYLFIHAWILIYFLYANTLLFI